MPKPVSTSELLLQQIADDLRDVKAHLAQQGAAAPQPATAPQAPPAKKSTQQRTKRTQVDGR